MIEERLDALISKRPVALYKAARYSLLAGGKRFRPLLVIQTAKLFGAELEKSLDPACAIEMIHTYSLIHDDLPCMDNDDFRRGKPSLHKTVTEGLALLTGDYLLTYAFEVLTKAPNLTATHLLRLIQILTKAIGAEGMIGGQAIDIELNDLDEANLETMHKMKTGALFTVSLQFGAVIGSAEERYFPLLEELGMSIGLAFQFLDDLLDGSHALSLYGEAALRKKLNELQISMQKLTDELPSPGIHELLGQHLWTRYASVSSH